MKTKSYLFAGIIAAIVSNNAYATGENTVTSKSYVDAQDALKQNKITAGTIGNVVTYNGTNNGQTQFSELGFFDMDNNVVFTGLENNGDNFYHVEPVEGHENDLISAFTFTDNMNSVWYEFDNMYGDTGTVVLRGNDGMPSASRAIYDGSTNYVAATDASKIPTASFVASKANPMTCAGWPDGTTQYDTTHTDANCWLWNKN